MSAAKDIFEKLVSAGVDVAEALGLLSRHAAESAPQSAPKNKAAERQKRYRETITNRNKTVTNHNASDHNGNVTNHNETVTRDAPIYISSNNKEEERKIDIPDRNALRTSLTADPEAREIARQRGLDIAETAAIFLDHSEGRGEKPTAGYFRNFLRKHNGPVRPSAPQIGDQPSLEDFERAAALFVKDNSKWGNRMGPEPGMGGCRCPTEILIRHGINPKTGLRMQ